MRAALYVHIPFCKSRCAYCDFNTYAGLEDLLPDYVTAVCREMEALGRRWGAPEVPTVYFGGGTPSLLSPTLLGRLLDTAARAFRLRSDAEISLEANPGTVNRATLRSFRSLGVNRLSLGVQSVHAEELRLLGRIHTWPEAVAAVTAAREAGFANLNLDFIFGLPGQTLARWEETLQAALALAPEHLSLYCLTVEADTPLARRIAAGLLPPPDDDRSAEMYQLAESRLADAGFFHYEISNWARAPSPPPRHWAAVEEVSPFVCRHNLVYWRNEPWLGVGAGAHSWAAGRRWANRRHPRAYIAALSSVDSPVVEEEVINRRLEMGETMMMGLRLAEGVSASRFRSRFGLELAQVFGEELAALVERGLLTWDGRAARLTAHGRLLGNQVFMEFL